MNTSESIKEIATALVKAQGQMGGVVKGSNNPFFKSKYADLTSVLQVIKKPLADNGLSYVQFPISEQQRVGVVTRLMHISGEFLESGFTVNVDKNTAQSAGSAISYCRRYSLQSIFGIPAVDDDGEAAEFRKLTEETISFEQQNVLSRLIKESGLTVNRVCTKIKVNSLDEISAESYEKVKFKLENIIKNKEIDHEK